MKNILLTLFITITPFFLFSQTTKNEVFIIGTMHQVPGIAKHSYKPLLKIAKKYEPDAIFVERVRSSDTLSLKNYMSEFLAYSDSIAQLFEMDEMRFEKLMTSSISQMTKADYDFLKTSFAIKKDYANYHYYRHLSRYGAKGSKKPLKNENDDLTAKLAIYLDHKYIYAMDDQQTGGEYYQAWRKCARVSRKNGDYKISKKLNAKDYRRSIFPAVFGGLGKYNNKAKSLDLMHTLNSFRYVTQESEACTAGTELWDLRNKKMSNHIASQVKAENINKSVVIVGAGHVVGLKEALEKYHPEITVKLINGN